MMPGTAKQRPIKAGENPYRYMWTANEGAKNWRQAVTKICEIKAKKNRIILKRTVIWIVSNYLVSVSFVSGSVVTIALLARISFSLALCSSRSHLV